MRQSNRPRAGDGKDDSQVTRHPSGASYSITGYNACIHCGCTAWEFDTERGTGSTIKLCRGCGAGAIINRGWIDGNLGVALSSPRVVGSWCSYSLASGWIRYEP